MTRSRLALAGCAAVAALAAFAAPAHAGTKFDSSFTRDLSGWTIGTAQVCTSAANVQVSGGLLHLITDRTGCGAKLHSTPTFHYGNITMRAKFDLAQGSHGGLTLYGMPMTAWPYNGEVDIDEELGRKPHELAVRVWTGAAGGHGTTRCGGSGAVEGLQIDGAWHIYGLNWQRGSMQVTFDGRTVWTWTAKQAQKKGCTYPFDAANFAGQLFLTMTTGGGPYAGHLPKGMKGYPLDTQVDYVRVS